MAKDLTGLDNIKVRDVFKGIISTDRYIVRDIYIANMKCFIVTEHLESGTLTHTDYNTFRHMLLEKVESAYDD